MKKALVKTNVILLLLICAPNILLQAQAAMEGHIRYLVTHNWSKKLAAVDYISKQRKERNAYMWGKEEWKEFGELFFTATQTKYQESEEKAEPDSEGWSWRRDQYCIKRDFEKNRTYDGVHVVGKNYIVEDSLYIVKWKVNNELKEVAGHLCMNAFWRDTVKDQDIVAWFALDIPTSGGPERYCGLPGLILEIDINAGAMVISADKIDLRNVSTELEPAKKLKGKKIKETEYQALIKKHVDQKIKDEEPWFWGLRY
jgi:GLPGLI family protein